MFLKIDETNKRYTNLNSNRFLLKNNIHFQYMGQKDQIQVYKV